MEERDTPGDVRAPASGPAARRSNKTKAPTPPLVAQNRGAGPRPPQRLPGVPPVAMEQKENLTDRDLTLTVVLPAGLEKTAVVHGSKPMMDLLVMLCAKYHLNPSSHTIELISTNKNHVKFKPNALIGALDVEKILLKRKGEDKNKKTDPQVPEATVRLVINYKRTQKTILRVNPRVPLGELLPAVCEKCEFQQKTTILSRDVQSEEPLDLSKSLNDFGLREVYARDLKENGPVRLQLSEVNQGKTEDKSSQSKEKVLKEKENKGLFSMFRRSKKRLDQVATASAPASPILNKQSRTTSTPSAASYSSMPSDVPKKRRAPLPPMLMSRSFPSSLNSQPQPHSPPSGLSEDDQTPSGFSHGFSSESCLKRTKRRAPPPPCAITPDDMRQDGGTIAEGLSQSPLEEIHEQEEVLCSVVLDPTDLTDCQGDDSSLNLSADASMDSGKSEPSSDPADIEALSCSPSEVTGEDLTGDLSSDGKLSRDSVDGRDCTEEGLNIEVLGLVQEENTETGISPTEQMSHQVGQSGENGPLSNEDTKWCQTGICAQDFASAGAPTPEPKTQGAGKQVLGRAKSEVSFEDESEQTGAPPEDRAIFLSGCPPGVHVGVRQQSSFSCEETPSVETALLKRDMATSTEDLIFRRGLSLSSQPPEGLHKSPKLLATPNSVYIKESEPKLKPSNELTRDYTPKVGLTTYTIMPPKSLEKLKFFGVELPLKSSRKEESAACETEAVDHCSQIGPPHLVEDQSEMYGSAPGVDSELNTFYSDSMGSYSLNHNKACMPQTALGLAVEDNEDKDSRPSWSSIRGLKADPALQVKQKKVPPAIKPKPPSFHLSQHKRTPEHYVTSAAMRNISGQNPAGSQSLVPEQDVKKLPTPLTKLRDENSTEGHKETAKMSPTGLSLEKLRSFAAPRPYMPANPSRFALAVSAAVKRSHSLTQGSTIQAHLAHPSCALTGRYSMKEVKEAPRSLGIQENEEERAALLWDVGHPGRGAESAAPMGVVDTSEAKETSQACREAMQAAAIVTSSTVPNA